jgi:amino acid adenylation domain-containing protein
MRFPVSFAQQRLWFLDQLNPGEPTYLMPYVMWLDGPLDAEALQQAMDAVATRHAALRTSIVATDGVPEQVISDTAAVPIERLALPDGLDDTQRTQRAEAIAAERARLPFDLAAGPLLRALLIDVAVDRHLLLLVMHHIVSDGLSMRILIDELSAEYQAQKAGTPVSRPEPWMDYGDYAVWQRDRMRGDELDRLLRYWDEQLRGAPVLLTLPTDRPRPPRQSTRGAVAKSLVDAATTRRLAAIAQGANATMFMVFLAGYAVALSRYASQSELVIGTPVSGRTHEDLDPIVGIFTNTVPLRVSLAGGPSFAELLARVRDTTADALSHQELPFETLVEEFAPDRTLAHAPLLQVQFAYQSLTTPALTLDGVTARGRVMFTQSAKLDLTLYADSSEQESTTLALEYSTDLFDPAWADRFLGCVEHLLECAAAAPGTPVTDLPMLPAGEQDELIAGRNARALPPGPDQPPDVRSLLRRSASRVIDGAGETAMTQVCERAARIARVLADHGVGLETPVGLCLGRGADMLAAMLGVWWAGGAYVPLDPGFPRARLAAMARGAGVQVVVSDGAHRDLAQAIADGIEVISADGPQTASARPLDPVPVPGRALAYIIFTSGSTGRPKGVGIEHRAVANLLSSFQRALPLGPGDRLAAVTTLSFDISLLELLLPPVCGAGLVIATSDEAREADRLRALIERASVTAMQATPQTWRMLLSAGEVPAGLRLRLCGGEALPPDLAEQLAAPGARLWNLYGPTETTVWSAAGVVADGTGPVDIGPPIDHTRVYILDDSLTPVPVGVMGEVYLAGRGVARGYHDQPRLTAQSFRPDPWGDEPGARMYRTGDLGRWREGAGLELAGRIDHQVKIRGFRIECGEIEAVLRAHRDVRQAAVVTATRGGESLLVAYVVPRRGTAAAQPDADLLREFRPHLRAALPDYMIPALITALPALPLTPNGKVDRAALPAPGSAAGRPAAGRVEPRNAVEATLARIWGDLLAEPTPVGVHDDLFALGGHSLTVTRFVVRVADACGVSLPVHTVFASPTIAELAEVVSADPDFGRSEACADPGLGPGEAPGRQADLDQLSDDDLDQLLRAALAERSRRQGAPGGPES